MKFRTAPANGLLSFAVIVAGSGVTHAGASEPEVVSVIFVDDDADPQGTGVSWEDAFDSLESALVAARDGSSTAIIYVAGGTYRPELPDPPGDPADATFDLTNVEAIIGGFLPGQLDPADRDLSDPATRTVFVAEAGSSPRHMITVPPSAVPVRLDAISVFGGDADGGIGGGGLTAEMIDVTLVNCGFFGGRSTSAGGAIALNGGSLRAINTVFAGNTANTGGGAYSGVGGASAEFVHCTFAGNRVTSIDGVGGVAASGVFLNCAFVENVAGDASTDHVGPDATVAWSVVRGGLPGDGNLDGIVRFVDALGPDGVPWTGDEDYRLGECSPGIDAASAAQLPADVVVDAASRPRRIDDLATPDTGEGEGPLPDAGAFESDMAVTDDFTARLVGGNWNDANQWSDGLPDPFTDAVLFGAGRATLATGTTSTCRELLLTGGELTLDLAAGPLTAGGGARIGLCGDEIIALTVTGGTLLSPAVAVGPAPNYVLAGDAIVDGNVTNLGTLRPGNLGNGPMRITGDLDQVGMIAPGEVIAGRVDIQLGRDDAAGSGGGGDPTSGSRLIVDGIARLGGALDITLAEGYYPPIGAQFVVLLADEIQGEFSTSQVPVIDPAIDPRVLTVQYGTIDGRDAITIEVEAAESIQRYRPSGPPTMTEESQGLPADLTRLDLGGDALEDVVVVVAEEDGPNGFMFAFKSLGLTEDGEFAGFEQTANSPFTVLGRPVAVATGNLDFGLARDSVVVARQTPGSSDSVLIFEARFGAPDEDFDEKFIDVVGVGDAGQDDRVSDVGIGNFDLDFNANNDIVVVTEGTGLAQILTNGSSGTGFTAQTALDLGVPLVAVDPGKIDDPRKNALADVAVIGGDDGAVFALASNGDGTLQVSDSFIVGRALRDVRMESLDGDGGDDIIVTDAGSAAVSVVQNDDGGSFLPPARTSLPDGFDRPSVLVVTDGEGDNDGDLVLVAEESGQNDDIDRDALNFRTSIDPQDGTIRFEVAEPLESNPDTRFVTPADVDGDGDEDLVVVSAVADENGDIMTVLEVFLNEDPSAIGCGPGGDLNCDGEVNFSDLPFLLSAWGPCGVGSCPEDLDGSGAVDTLDLLVLLSNWTG